MNNKTFSWAALEQMAKGKRPIPAGFKLEYEFRPSLIWYPDIHQVHAFWQSHNPDTQLSFWLLDSDVQKEWEQKYLETKYRVFTGRRYMDCAWQRFTLTDTKGQKFILQMNNQGYVDQLKEVQVTQTILVKV